MKYKCTVCGHLYEPEQGDNVGGVPEGTDFEDLPGEWSCPVCGIAKAQYVPDDSGRRNGASMALNGLKSTFAWIKGSDTPNPSVVIQSPKRS